jgi:hypothetical protein
MAAGPRAERIYLLPAIGYPDEVDIPWIRREPMSGPQGLATDGI